MRAIRALSFIAITLVSFVVTAGVAYRDAPCCGGGVAARVAP